jgi:16S rRNA (cytidine1402-2'-O)-methyltransferase
MKKLLLIGNHIGNPMDISRRALEELTNADMIIAERPYLMVELAEELGISVTQNIVQAIEMSDEVKAEVVSLLKSDKSVVFISDAGLPMIADPGIVIAHFLFENDLEIDIIPGPSIPSIAHAVSALDPFNSNFLFQEFMQYSTEDIAPYMELFLKPLPHSLVLIDLPPRFIEMLNICLDVLGDRNAALLMMLTTDDSNIVRGKLSELINYCLANDFPKLLNTIVIAGDRSSESNSSD